MKKTYRVVDKMVDIFGDWLRRGREIRELRELDNGEYTKIARELDMMPADLDTFVRQGAHSADELPKLLTSLGIDSESLSRTQPFVVRDMARVCASCKQKRRCDRDLAAGTSEQHYEEYCLNASTVDGLRTTADRFEGH